jgi:hypothetical protein
MKLGWIVVYIGMPLGLLPNLPIATEMHSNCQICLEAKLPHTRHSSTRQRMHHLLPRYTLTRKVTGCNPGIAINVGLLVQSSFKDSGMCGAVCSVLNRLLGLLCSPLRIVTRVVGLCATSIDCYVLLTIVL